MPSPVPSRITWKETHQRLAQDSIRIRQLLRSRFGTAPSTLFFDASFRCVFLHRLAHYFWRRDSRKAARLVMQINTVMTGADIHPACDFGGGLLIPQPAAISASGNAGRNLTMMPLSGIGMLPRNKDVGAGPGLPMLGDDVWLGSGSGVLGAIVVGNGSRLQPGAALCHDVPPNSVVSMRALPVQRDTDAAAPVRKLAGQTCDHHSLRKSLCEVDLDVMRYLRARDGNRFSSPNPMRKLSATLSTEVVCVALYRASHLLYCNRWRGLARLISGLNLLLFRLSVSPQSCVAGGFFLPHPAGTVIDASAGANLTTYARVVCAAMHPTLCVARPEEEAGSAACQRPVLGKRVVIAGMAAVLGPVTVGDDTRVGFNVQVASDVPAGCVAAGTVMTTRIEPLLHSETLSTADDEAPDLAADRGVAQVTFAHTRRMLMDDRRRLQELHGGAAPWTARVCVSLFRYARYLLGRRAMRCARTFWWLNVRLTGADLDPRSDIEGGLVVPHPVGISLHARAGRNLTVLALASIGPQHAHKPTAHTTAELPCIGNDVVIGVHASLHGPVHVGDGARIGSGCKILWDLAPGADVAMPPPRIRRVPTRGDD